MLKLATSRRKRFLQIKLGLLTISLLVTQGGTQTTRLLEVCCGRSCKLSLVEALSLNLSEVQHLLLKCFLVLLLAFLSWEGSPHSIPVNEALEVDSVRPLRRASRRIIGKVPWIRLSTTVWGQYPKEQLGIKGTLMFGPQRAKQGDCDGAVNLF